MHSVQSYNSYIDVGINNAITDCADRYFSAKGLQCFNWQGCKRNSWYIVLNKDG